MMMQSSAREACAACTTCNDSSISNTAFRQVEKRYKLFQVPRRVQRRRAANADDVDLSDVVDFHNIAANSAANQAMIHAVPLHSSPSSSSSSCATRCFTFSGVPGLLIFPGACSMEEQTRWCREAILHYGDSARHPNILSTHAKTPRPTTCYQPPMRWATLGFSYAWTTKTYAENVFSSFPHDVRCKMEELVRLVEEVQQDGYTGRGATAEMYEPQTAIVNYYPVGSMMMCHQDISEEVLDQPLISLSLGCSSIFLMGTTSREDKPHAFLLRSGDVAVFSGASRCAFHAVPRILDDCPTFLTLADDEITAEELAKYENHCYTHTQSPDRHFEMLDKSTLSEEEQERYWKLCMRHLRININARQVYGHSCPKLFSESSSTHS